MTRVRVPVLCVCTLGSCTRLVSWEASGGGRTLALWLKQEGVREGAGAASTRRAVVLYLGGQGGGATECRDMRSTVSCDQK